MDNPRKLVWELPPPQFMLLPVTDERGRIIGFTIYDPTGRLIHRKGIVVVIPDLFPSVTREEIENARIGYEEYVAHVLLPGRMT